jgi:H+/Cl- antiporter ClcA
MNTLTIIFLVFYLIVITIYGLVIYYLYELEGEGCNCIMDWRHDFIKYYTMALCFIVIVKSVMLITQLYNKINTTILLIFNVIFALLAAVNVYAFFTYVGDVQDDKNCKCAGEKHPNLNSMMNVLRWIYIVLFSIAIIGLLLGIYAAYRLKKIVVNTKSNN